MEEKDKIIGIACRITGITESDFYNKRTYLVSKARMLVYRHFEEKGMYHQQIAQMVGRSRGTVTSHLNGFRLDYKYDKKFRDMCDEFKEVLNTEEE